jgi:hypothetical protein
MRAIRSQDGYHPDLGSQSPFECGYGSVGPIKMMMVRGKGQRGGREGRVQRRQSAEKAECRESAQLRGTHLLLLPGAPSPNRYPPTPNVPIRLTKLTKLPKLPKLPIPNHLIAAWPGTLALLHTACPSAQCVTAAACRRSSKLFAASPPALLLLSSFLFPLSSCSVAAA